MSTLKSVAELAAEVQAGDEQKQDGLNPKEQREYTFEFEHKDTWGKTRRGKFTNTCLSPNQRIKVGVLRAHATGHVPEASLDGETAMLAERIAWLTVSLVKRPDWAADLGALMDVDIIHKLYAEVADHEATFHRRGSDQAEGEGADEKPVAGSAGVDGEEEKAG